MGEFKIELHDGKYIIMLLSSAKKIIADKKELSKKDVISLKYSINKAIELLMKAEIREV